VRRGRGEGLHIHLNELRAQTLVAFEPAMLPMSIAFIVFGGLIGLLIGIVIERKRKLIEAEHENEKKRIVLETIKRLMVTISHYLLNANMIIGGKVRHSRKAVTNEDVLAALEVIEEQGRKIDAVIKSLREITELKTSDYTTGGKVKMIDIAQEIENRLELR
jgi:phosphate uptake regulator